jgi:hypothetical protein
MKLIVLAALITSSACLDVQSRVKVVVTVAQKLRSVCIYLLHGNQTGKLSVGCDRAQRWWHVMSCGYLCY